MTVGEFTLSSTLRKLITSIKKHTMKEIKAKQITLRNFKGEKLRTVEFGNITQIKGDNRTGKTTIVDAYNWVLFGKDSKGDTDFDIKTLDANNEPIHKLDHEVELVLQDGTKLRKVYKEVWGTTRGNPEEFLKTHTTDHFFNEKKIPPSEYKAKISEIIDENISRIISDPKYFNSDDKQKGLGVDGRRAILSDMAQTPTSKEIVQNSAENLQDVVNIINQGKKIEDELSIAKAKIKLSKDELKTIDPKIDENIRIKPEPLDYAIIEKNIEETNALLSNVQEQINDVSKSTQVQATANAELIKSKAQKESEYSRLDSELRSAPNKELDLYYKELSEKKEELREVTNDRDDATRFDERINYQKEN
jgi:DNA repair protein SbcC/Rad50